MGKKLLNLVAQNINLKKNWKLQEMCCFCGGGGGVK